MRATIAFLISLLVLLHHDEVTALEESNLKSSSWSLRRSLRGWSGFHALFDDGNTQKAPQQQLRSGGSGANGDPVQRDLAGEGSLSTTMDTPMSLPGDGGNSGPGLDQGSGPRNDDSDPAEGSPTKVKMDTDHNDKADRPMVVPNDEVDTQGTPSDNGDAADRPMVLPDGEVDMQATPSGDGDPSIQLQTAGTVGSPGATMTRPMDVPDTPGEGSSSGSAGGSGGPLQLIATPIDESTGPGNSDTSNRPMVEPTIGSGGGEGSGQPLQLDTSGSSGPLVTHTIGGESNPTEGGAGGSGDSGGGTGGGDGGPPGPPNQGLVGQSGPVSDPETGGTSVEATPEQPGTQETGTSDSGPVQMTTGSAVVGGGGGGGGVEQPPGNGPDTPPSETGGGGDDSAVMTTATAPESVIMEEGSGAAPQETEGGESETSESGGDDSGTPTESGGAESETPAESGGAESETAESGGAESGTPTESGGGESETPTESEGADMETPTESGGAESESPESGVGGEGDGGPAAVVPPAAGGEPGGDAGVVLAPTIDDGTPPCENDDTFEFASPNGEIRICAWIEREGQRNFYCTEDSEITTKCARSCQMCPEAEPENGEDGSETGESGGVGDGAGAGEGDGDPAAVATAPGGGPSDTLGPADTLGPPDETPAAQVAQPGGDDSGTPGESGGGDESGGGAEMAPEAGGGPADMLGPPDESPAAVETQPAGTKEAGQSDTPEAPVDPRPPNMPGGGDPAIAVDGSDAVDPDDIIVQEIDPRVAFQPPPGADPHYRNKDSNETTEDEVVSVSFVCGRDAEEARRACRLLPVCKFEKNTDGRVTTTMVEGQGACARRCDPGQFNMGDDHCREGEHCFDSVENCRCPDMSEAGCKPF
eukprot:CAMPEP_0194070774 /NCGR_PEP_ID=MMETSP0009_2-20130614/88355_1 /TAXON_ID=210454 /ORGANISM="Grammatophora oceanica, Strain CCMP 410" /LENGTH=876 /DNA_ID=CAMNT_0038724061 /DNA_START=120 /DNA_END=2750 /DNA_ORIENTATION=-